MSDIDNTIGSARIVLDSRLDMSSVGSSTVPQFAFDDALHAVTRLAGAVLNEDGYAKVLSAITDLRLDLRRRPEPS